ncbi:ABC transporter substrate-binding protein [Pseudoclavibacter chungangensis]|uniref:ABC transporter substrate-binding protein n=1 Tax=Pseudoclavibacter chungangensis TaxID=587635 RepID=A0A7J5BSN7_9MICO|nr:ABC transporter substrate-binding protein [Pseudoclavibacter chungangensis]KAB1656293.1 ABC transporter substrate-binding protein [Pseudoclavibacter chungangensis]NYJ67053.1 sn-glycerol 3-phosphate transport system substrate-binding protein [Pseudoclavibacter chungangensis]
MTIRIRTPKLLAVTASVGVATLALTGCGPAVGGTDTASEAVDFSGVTPADSITFWTNHPGGSTDVEKQITDAFTAETGITVNIVTAGANYEEVSQKFQAAQGSNDIGDVVVVSDATWFTNYLNGSLLPVDDALAAAGADVSTYQETLYNDYLYEGAHFAAPYARSTPIFYYNKSQYSAAGLPDQAPATWDDVKANGEKLKAANAAASSFTFPPQDEYPAWTMANIVWAYGGNWSNEWDMSPMTSDATVEAVTFAQNGVKDGWANVASGDPADDFAAGATSSFIGSTGSLGGLLETAQFEIGVGFLPGGPAGSDDVVPTGGAGLGISSKSTPEKQLAAAKFIDFLTNAENTATFSASTGYLPVRTDADMSEVYATTPAFEVAVKQLAKTRNQDFGRVLLPGGDLTISTALQTILTTDADVKTTLQGAQDEMTSLYENDLKPRLGA